MGNLVEILVFNNEYEARLLEGVLIEKSIPHIIRSYHDSVYDGIFQQSLGWGHLETPLEYKEEVLKIYDSLKYI